MAPLVCGWLGARDDASDRLWTLMSGVDATLDRSAFEGGWVAAATHAGRKATWGDLEGNVWAVYGERSLSSSQTNGASPLFRFDEERRLVLAPETRGVVAAFDAVRHTFSLACDALNYFPVYFCHSQGQFVFGSHLWALSRAVSASPDPAGVMEYLRENWCLNGRTVFANIRRILPGQMVEFDPSSGAVTVAETSTLWAGVAEDHRAPTDEDIWQLLLEGVRTHSDGTIVAGLMLSGGWDSRVMLAALSEVFQQRVVTLTHGAAGHRELELARSLADRVSARHIQIELGPGSVGNPSEWDAMLTATDTLVFPWWRFAGPALVKHGARVGFTGLLGEVLGGHYTVVGRGRHQRAGEVFRRSVLRSAKQTLSPEAGLRQVLAQDYRQRRIPFLKKEAATSFEGVAEEGIACDMDAMVHRYLRRGIVSAGRIVEAYNTEYRALDHFCQQPIMIHAHLDSAVPLGYRPLFEAILKVPVTRRIHNSLSRTLLRKFQPALLQVPLAASPFVPASAPILVQEGGRVVRRVVDQLSRQAYLLSGGQVGTMRRFGWMDFEGVVRTGDFLDSWRDSLTWEGLDRTAIDNYVDSIRSHKTPVRLARPILKLAYLDRMFRADAVRD